MGAIKAGEGATEVVATELLLAAGADKTAIDTLASLFEL